MEDSDLTPPKEWPWTRHGGRHFSSIMSSSPNSLVESSQKGTQSRECWNHTVNPESFSHQLFDWIPIVRLALDWWLPRRACPAEAGADGAPGQGPASSITSQHQADTLAF